MEIIQQYKIFLNEKKQALEKKDKSSKGSIDRKILSLINLINNHPFLYTTSSCSGRITILRKKDKKEKKAILKSWHKKITPKDLINSFKKIKEKEIVYFQFDPFILHIICFDFDLASKIVSIARNIGFKRSGFYYGKRKLAIIEIRGNDILSFPIYKNKILLNKKYINLLVKEANEKMERNFKKIKKFHEEMKILLKFYSNKNII